MLSNFQESVDIEPLELSHFPTLQQAVVWRNWELVPVERLAKVLRTDEDNILELALGLGLRVPPEVGDLWLTRGYITIIRANWHLLPYEQLLELLGWKAEQLAFTLKEDDFLWVKLGSLKPLVLPVIYEPLSDLARKRTETFRGLIQRHFPDTSIQSAVKPFDFLAEFEHITTPVFARSYGPANPGEIVIDESWAIEYSQEYGRVQSFAARFIAGHEAKWGIQLSMDTLSSVYTDKRPSIILAIQPDPSLLSESHIIEVAAHQIRITAVDEVGLLRGLQWLEASMAQRGAPYVKQETIRRNTQIDLRFMYSYFAVYGDPLLEPDLDPYPDELLSRLSNLGINGVWLQVVLYNLVPMDEAPELSVNWEKRVEGLRRLVERAANYGIGVYLYYNEPRAMPLEFFGKYPNWKGHTVGGHAALCTSQIAVQDFIKRGTARLFTEVPKLAGLFTITMSENLTNCYSRAHLGKTNCPHCANRPMTEVIVEVNRLIAEGAHSVNPDARILCWTWGWTNHFGWNRKMVKEAIEGLPDDVSVMCTSEDEMPTSIAGIPGRVSDYSISIVGPGDKSRESWETAAIQGLSSVAKVQFNNSWECSAVPYLPTMNLIEQHVTQLTDSGVTGFMLGWTLGGYPSLNLELAAQYYWDDGNVRSSTALAEKAFGGQASVAVKEAWSSFSEAFQQFPFHISVLYHAPQNMGPANLLHSRPTGFKATMVGIPYDDLEGWRAIYPSDIFENQFKKLSDGWLCGIEHLNIAEQVINYGNNANFEDLMSVARGAYCHFRSAYLQISFVRLRDRLEQTKDIHERKEITDRLADVIDEEIHIAKSLHDIVLRDSRIGFEASNHYFYTLQDLREKVVNCEYVRNSLI